MGYCSSLNVVIVSALFKKNGLAVILASVFATIYNSIWDIRQDWGLGAEELAFFARRTGAQLERSISPGSSAETPVFRQLTPVVEESQLEEQEKDFTKQLSAQKPQRTPRKQEQMKRFFSPGFYCAAACFDVLARCAWVLTLLPIDILSDSTVQRALLLVFTSATEIARRSLWAVLRMEHEQIANASGFRALLWVPTKLNEEGMYLAMT